MSIAQLVTILNFILSKKKKKKKLYTKVSCFGVDHQSVKDLGWLVGWLVDFGHINPCWVFHAEFSLIIMVYTHKHETVSL